MLCSNQKKPHKTSLEFPHRNEHHNVESSFNYTFFFKIESFHTSAEKN